MEQKKRSKKFHKFFIIMFPDGNQVMVHSKKSWSGLIPYTKYLKEEFEDGTVFVAINWWEAIMFVLKGRVFNVGK